MKPCNIVSSRSALTADRAVLFSTTKTFINSFDAMDANNKFTAIISTREPSLVKALSS